MGTCICGHSEKQHEASVDQTFIDWCNARGCPCQRFTDQSQVAFDLDDDDDEPTDPELEDFGPGYPELEDEDS